MKPLRNVAASVRQRLLNRARSEQRPFNELLQYYAMERFLYRLSVSAHAERFVLKGALMLRAWRTAEFRPTKDIDLLGRTSNDEAGLCAQFREILSTKVEADGLEFDPASIQVERITEDADYEGIRIRFRGVLDTAIVSMQIDIGFGDVVFPAPETSDLPTMLDFPTPRLLGYSRESAIAEKFQAMVRLREINSRMKDFYDIWLLSRLFDFEGSSLVEAIRLTFERRGAPLEMDIPAFTDEFAKPKQAQWVAFRNRLQQSHVPIAFGEIVSTVRRFLEPIASALAFGAPAPGHWAHPGPWKSSRPA